MTGLLLAIRLVLAAVFTVASVAKLLDRPGSRQSMREFGVPPVLAGPLAIAVPVAELVCALALLATASAWWGAVGALALLLVFTLAIVVNLAQGRTPDCHCFGKVHSEPVGWGTVARNGALAAAALVVILQGPTGAGPGLLAWLSSLERTESFLLALAVGLLAVAAGTAFVVFQLLAQNGRLMARLEAIEKKLGGREALETPEPSGLPVGEKAPEFRATALDGSVVTLGVLAQGGIPTMLLFAEPGCGACEGLLPSVAAWQRDHAERLSIVVVTRGDLNAAWTRSAEHGLGRVVLQLGREVSDAYGVKTSPSAVLVKDGLIASTLAVGPDAIRALVLAHTLPPPVKVGDRVPRLELTDLDGQVVDLGALDGHRTVLLFWNPDCGFCRAMLGELRSWERVRPRTAPELVVISTGTVEVNREQSFRSRVLLDPVFGAGKVFGVGGTPSAVLVEDGRVASEVGVGAPAVMELMGEGVRR